MYMNTNNYFTSEVMKFHRENFALNLLSNTRNKLKQRKEYEDSRKAESLKRKLF
jgi:hypothetical protein